MSGTFTGETPNWVAGYVPPAGEWNQWWSRKVDTDNFVFDGAPFLSLAGGQMTGALLLPPTDPIAPDEAVRKAYVDSLTFAAGPFMPASGGTFSGPVTFTSSATLSGNPLNPLDAAPKQYVDSATNQANNALTVASAAVRRAGDTMTGLLTLSSDPVAANNAATKSYADLKVAKTGDTMTGRLTVNSDMVVNGPFYNVGTFYMNTFNGWEWNFAVDGSGSRYQTYRTGWYDVWDGAIGTRCWMGNGSILMALDGQGNLNAAKAMITGTMYTTDIQAVGNVLVYGTTTTGALVMGPWSFYNNGDQIQQHTAGWYKQWRSSDGLRLWVGGNVTQMSLDGGGSLAVTGNITGAYLYSRDAVLARSLFADNQNIYIGPSGASRVHQYQGNWYWQWENNSGNLTWYVYNGGVRPLWQFRPSDMFCYNPSGDVGGNNFQYFSDERTKTDIRLTSCGLADIIRIEPIVYRRPNETSQHIGFSAQQLRGVIPEAVSPMGIKLPDGTGGLDDDEPTLGVYSLAIVAALVNAVKELATEITQLKAAR